jgi:large subunit ribosomal protein L21
MTGYAILEIGGKQHRVMAGENLRVDFMAGRKVGEKFDVERVLMVGGESYKIGKPFVSGALVSCTVTAGEGKSLLGDKVRVYKKKRRKGFTKTIGHRQQYTEISIDTIKA